MSKMLNGVSDVVFMCLCSPDSSTLIVFAGNGEPSSFLVSTTYRDRHLSKAAGSEVIRMSAVNGESGCKLL